MREWDDTFPFQFFIFFIVAYLEIEASEWLTPFSLEFIFSIMLLQVPGFILDTVFDFTHCVRIPTCNSATCFTLAEITGNLIELFESLFNFNTQSPFKLLV